MKRDANQLDRLVKRADSMMEKELDPVMSVAETLN